MFLSKEKYLNFTQKFPLDSVGANEKRQKSYEDVIALGLPTKNEEYWKFTSLKKINDHDWQFVPTEDALTHDQMKLITNSFMPETIKLVFVNGFLNATLSNSEFVGLHLADMQKTDFVESSNRLNTLNQAFSYQTKNIKITNEIKKPVQIIVFNSTENLFLNDKIAIQVDPLVSSAVILSVLSEKINSTNINLNVQIAQGAQLDFFHNNALSLNSYLFTEYNFSLKTDSRLNCLHLNAGSDLSRNDVNITFKDSNAEARLHGLVLAEKSQHADYLTAIIHEKGHNFSAQNHKTILSGKAQSVFRGRVRIEQDAQKAHSEQLCKNLILTPTAQAISVPQLEIYADDVKASHGATQGELNKEEIFYFLSRGVSAKEATELLAFGFALDQISVFKNDDLKHFAEVAIKSKLQRMIANA